MLDSMQSSMKVQVVSFKRYFPRVFQAHREGHADQLLLEVHAPTAPAFRLLHSANVSPEELPTEPVRRRRQVRQDDDNDDDDGSDVNQKSSPPQLSASQDWKEGLDQQRRGWESQVGVIRRKNSQCDQILPLWQNFKSLWQIFGGLM